ncbi:MAG: hypothetical protein ACD_17C00464G0003 [uncultured bacterium]|nr:MAG: hypothetical protein ACD_17C00464G0003 [uncultured bacterium]OGN55974.1 MAG: hypothetical protein A2796_00320 [Chlamydiae bacterium RIFCSPHIGHO2_01_FULL_44_39]OGN56715.1 MAG: hypothetical protein A3C42_06090 [Chlamydiae bacterium RIFCSPHIGHO2_02_FULL_45_9]OGN60587.1 MAG: hypothetical protein A3D96_03255 [Chlamydiae bacterium RIFCSPHIGHO2_12_FULL_44_59]OGN66404.1 MAG: hypothetical protein A2978_03775 [Chlamydiae bacterium RIFCSPLOWO2_01_FULL_44_52]OGN69454.1 MAG: hypothetical protein A3
MNSTFNPSYPQFPVCAGNGNPFLNDVALASPSILSEVVCAVTTPTLYGFACQLIDYGLSHVTPAASRIVKTLSGRLRGLPACYHNSLQAFSRVFERGEGQAPTEYSFHFIHDNFANANFALLGAWLAIGYVVMEYGVFY